MPFQGVPSTPKTGRHQCREGDTRVRNVNGIANPTALRAAAYIRVSTEEQVDGHSLDAQRRAIEQACADRGWTIVEWYADEGVSAHTDDITKRPAFHQLVQAAQQHRFDAVVVHRLDRFARSVVVALGTFKLLSNLGVTFLSLSEAGMDFTSPMGKVLFGLLALFAEYYSENLGVETKKGKTERRAKGLHNGLVPFGYRSEAGSMAEPHPDTSDGARLAFRLAAEGQTLRQVAQALNQAGYRTAGNMRRGVFSKDTVRDMLANRFYLGQLPIFEPGTSRRIRGWEPGQHQPLIAETTFEAALSAIKARGAGKTANRRNATVYSLSGLLRCARCGERMRVAHNMHGRIRYHCRRVAQGLGCSGRGSFHDVYEQQIAEDLTHFELPADWQRVILELARAEQESPSASVGETRSQLERRLERLQEMYEWGDIDRQDYQRKRKAIEHEIASLTPVAKQTEYLDALAAYVESLPAAWADADQSQRNEVASMIYEAVFVDGPVVEYVRPRSEWGALFQSRLGSAQPCLRDQDCQRNVAEATPMGFEPTISTVTGWHV
jgi:site-specific DNA recombinase